MCNKNFLENGETLWWNTNYGEDDPDNTLLLDF